MGIFLFLLIFFFVLLPIGRAAWAFWRQYRAVKRQFRAAEEFRQAYRRAAGFDGGDGAAPRRDRAQRKKKISRDVGEYVAFEEIRTFDDGADSAAAPQPGRPESQIEDADWEEIR